MNPSKSKPAAEKASLFGISQSDLERSPFACSTPATKKPHSESVKMTTEKASLFGISQSDLERSPFACYTPATKKPHSEIVKPASLFRSSQSDLKKSSFNSADKRKKPSLF
ncbi:hypothetical protein I7I51_05360 [Histoplasma capsulatum]|uniref:Uncharacterized protein n=1 Tax=Ajellomyces capsulatus TaxID=5037 RepID=A0A8A1M5G8_AJECA|nr:hypothetical protein I7I51_05360 [Histoplasma capsulatum]